LREGKKPLRQWSEELKNALADTGPCTIS
jgi:hypothetical protein